MTPRTIAAAAAVLLGLAGPVSAQAPADDPLPAGPGKDVVVRVCTACHDATEFAFARYTPDEWDFEITKMQSAGAEMTAEEQLAISAYLAKYLSKPAAPAPAAPNAPAPTPKAAALSAGDWRRAAGLGASAAEVVRALQAKGRFADIVPDEAVVTIDPDNTVDVVALKPLPPLTVPGATGPGVRTAGLSGSGFAFTAKPGAIILYPAFAQSFAPQGAPPRSPWRHPRAAAIVAV